MAEVVDWQVVVADAPLCFELADYDRWGEFLFRALGGGGGLRQTPGEPFFIEYTRQPLASRLWLIRLLDGRTIPVVVGLGEQQEDQVEPWRRAVAEATQALGLPDGAFAWRAILGPSPLSMNRCLIELAEPTAVGGLKLRPGGVKRVAIGPPQSQFPQYNCGTILPCWPFFVEGTSSGYNWNAASTLAAHDLHRLATLVSLAWGSHWDVHHMPAPIERAWNAIPERDSRDEKWGANETSNSSRQALPQWVPAIWHLLDDDPALASALGAHHQGLALREQHPSFAVVAFVAAIESIGAKVSPAARCVECGSTPGAAERFRAALRRVMPEEKAKALAKEVYSRRSRTAHAGALHGAESVRGAVPYFGAFSRPAEHEFSWLVWQVEQASRNVLLDAVKRLAEPSPSPEATG